MAKQSKEASGVIVEARQKSSNPVIESEALQTEILQRLANGETLTLICRDVGVKPHHVYTATNSNKDFGLRFARAREFGDMVLEDQAIDYSDESNIDEETVETSGERGTVFTKKRGDNVARSRLRADTRLKVVARRKGAKITQQIKLDKKLEEEQVMEMSNEQLLMIASMETDEQKVQ